MVYHIVFQANIRPPVVGDSSGSREGSVDGKGKQAQLFRRGYINNALDSHSILEMRIWGKFEVLFDC